MKTHEKVKNYLRALLPSSAWLAGVAGVVVLLIAYFFVAQYSDVFIEREGIGAFETAGQDPLARFLFYTPWAMWVDRALDFLFWGVIAAIVIVLAWAVGASKTSFANHKLVEKFQNFNADARQWNQSFMVAVILRVLLAFIGLYLLGAVITRFVPNLSVAVDTILYKRTLGNILDGFLKAFFLWLAVAAIISCIKIFRHIEID